MKYLYTLIGVILSILTIWYIAKTFPENSDYFDPVDDLKTFLTHFLFISISVFWFILAYSVHSVSKEKSCKDAE